jgi:hypothetical protein
MVENRLVVVGTGEGNSVWFGAGAEGYGKSAERQPALISTAAHAAQRIPYPACMRYD